MSGIHVSRGDGDVLMLTVGDASLEMTELRVRDNSNFRVPHKVLGKGGACVAVTDEQLAVIVAEFLRYRLTSSIDVRRAHVNWEFVCCLKLPD